MEDKVKYVSCIVLSFVVLGFLDMNLLWKLVLNVVTRSVTVSLIKLNDIGSLRLILLFINLDVIWVKFFMNE